MSIIYDDLDGHRYDDGADDGDLEGDVKKKRR
jgi:hypothetical protein